MEASTIIKQMLAGNIIVVPSYQRAYSWETETEKGRTPKHVNVFLSDLEDYIKSTTTSPYYFGHFLFEKKQDKSFGVIDGQQRLTTIIIFLSALFTRLKSMRELTDEEEVTYEDIIRRKGVYRFETVKYDNDLFKEYVIDQRRRDRHGLKTEFAKRIVNAFDYFTDQLSGKTEDELLKLLHAVQNATCTTHPVENESEAIQMFIFQNNRGKKPSNLEIIKAQFMFHVHLYGGVEKDGLIKDIENRFETIYESISSIERWVDEDDVLLYTQRVYFKSLWESNSIEKISSELSKDTRLSFIRDFTYSLSVSFEHLSIFFVTAEKESIEIHSLITLGGFSMAMPFIIKAYTFGLSHENICKLCSALESLILRDRLIGTRADMTSRINEVYQQFTVRHSTIVDIINRINRLKNEPSESWWWAYWNNNALQNALQHVHPSNAKFLLWRYENYLESKGENGYLVSRYDRIVDPELEHIAPKTENPEVGYEPYDEEFRNQYLDCLGNYLLLSKSHNCVIGNKPFANKLNSYTHSEQQREIKTISSSTNCWTKELIQQRKEKIIKFILDTF